MSRNLDNLYRSRHNRGYVPLLVSALVRRLCGLPEGFVLIREGVSQAL